MTRTLDNADDSGGVRAGTLLWEPSAERVRDAGITHYLEFLAAERGLSFAGPDELWRWSATELGAFWDSVWDFCGVRGERGDGPALADARMPGAVWFPGAKVNYAQNALTRRGEEPALIAVREDAATVVISWDELRRQVARCAAGLRRLGVHRGDRVAAVLPNCAHTVIAMLATASIGAVWSSCSPDFGPSGLADRFSQISPKVLITVDGYTYNGTPHGILHNIDELVESLPSLAATVVVPYLSADVVERVEALSLPGMTWWDELVIGLEEKPTFEPMPFAAPLWILYSSGTTGLPKPIVHSHGGILLEHLKSLSLHLDLGPDDRFCWFTTTGWMMWNFLVSGLLVGSTIVLYDGSPSFPDLSTLWRLVEALGLTCLGVSAAFLHSCLGKGLAPCVVADLSTLRTVGSTGSPLSTDGYAWVYDSVKPDVLLTSISGGTDVCGPLAAALPISPVRAGEIGMRALGCAADVFDDAGTPVVDEVGELVVTAPMPSMPLLFWGDRDGSRLRESYFSTYPGVWRHGDFARLTPSGAVVIEGRSDATLNRGGVRLGTAELYRVVERFEGITDSLVVDTSGPGQSGHLLLFVVPTRRGSLTQAMIEALKAEIRTELTPRHVPDRIIEILDVPRTLTGKKLEVPVKRLLTGVPLDRAVSLAAVANPEALAPFIR
ncbi:acetoacetate--CoA ligase [Frankia sp. CNm7]|uniref:Acetoacetate--CoA ligase n=1 Tax=Frankia nepalensis TaxID=1836974 RepID=A0A937RV11_9ACTN|nr:acetoacetate--CoA ligase [Frankia nepalensis]MBL7498174.1 acetoacetate--CoA ligase [Frankia nepalensis]MBL7511690.1 acetoacetate--CoA ligase [Frankia nepalensis]MBL7518294.1 acetoacetate--CoA ligase [Frankia nepalensis]MBL7632396.1 acetoacetate--CoA ligase [Frankia nepalensis]